MKHSFHLYIQYMLTCVCKCCFVKNVPLTTDYGQTSESPQLGERPGRNREVTGKLQYNVIVMIMKELQTLTDIEEALKTASQCNGGFPGRDDI